MRSVCNAYENHARQSVASHRSKGLVERLSVGLCMSVRLEGGRRGRGISGRKWGCRVHAERRCTDGRRRTKQPKTSETIRIFLSLSHFTLLNWVARWHTYTQRANRELFVKTGTGIKGKEDVRVLYTWGQWRASNIYDNSQHPLLHSSTTHSINKILVV